MMSLKNHFSIEIITLCFELIGNSSNYPILVYYTLFFKILYINKYKEKLQSYFHFLERWPSTTTLVDLAFLILTIAHYFACGFHLLANII